MGKYTELIKKRALQRIPTADVRYQDKVDQVKRDIGPIESTAALARDWAQLRQRKDALKDELSDIDLMLEARAQLLGERFEAEGLTRIVLEGGAAVGVQQEPTAVVEDPQLFQKWCIDSGLLPKLILPVGTRDSLIKEYLLNGDPEPPGTKAYFRVKYVFTKGRGD